MKIFSSLENLKNTFTITKMFLYLWKNLSGFRKTFSREIKRPKGNTDELHLILFMKKLLHSQPSTVFAFEE